MKITPIPPQSSISKFKRTSGPAGTFEAAPRGNDEVQISESAQSFAAVYKAVLGEISNTSPEYTAKVEQITRRIEEGTYSVSSEDVAQKMLEDISI